MDVRAVSRAIIVAAMLAPFSPAQAAWNEAVLHAFGGTDGSEPAGALTPDREGNYYGATFEGGASVGTPNCPSGCGVLFELTPPGAGQTGWTETVLYSFLGGVDGSGPTGGLVRDAAGNLYGTTDYGGAVGAELCEYGCGTVFELSPPAAGKTVWTKTILHDFMGYDGFGPDAGVNRDASGNLYGTTNVGGTGEGMFCTYGCGTVFEVSPPAKGQYSWTETVLHSFTGSADGGAPYAGVIRDAAGNLYGTTSEGGNTSGTVFELSPPAGGQSAWTKTILHACTGGPDTIMFSGVISDAAGNLYGGTYAEPPTTYGNVFRLSPPAAGQSGWTMTVLYTFNGEGSAFTEAVAGLSPAADGGLFGTRDVGGTYNEGTVFKLKPPAAGMTAWTETILYSFAVGADGGNPSGRVVHLGAKTLLGQTGNGGNIAACSSVHGTPIGCGTIFSLTW
jgi:uncharacterized repeat protein (TIGR03803 family)